MEHHKEIGKEVHKEIVEEDIVDIVAEVVHTEREDKTVVEEHHKEIEVDIVVEEDTVVEEGIVDTEKNSEEACMVVLDKGFHKAMQR